MAREIAVNLDKAEKKLVDWIQENIPALEVKYTEYKEDFDGSDMTNAVKLLLNELPGIMRVEAIIELANKLNLQLSEEQRGKLRTEAEFLVAKAAERLDNGDEQSGGTPKPGTKKEHLKNGGKDVFGK